MPRRQGRLKDGKPWDRKPYYSRRKRKRVGAIKEAAKARKKAE